MKTQTDVLKALSEEKNEAGEPVAIAAPALAKKVGTTADSLRSQLSALKRKGYVDGSGTEGWWIVSEGRDALERGEEIPTTPQDIGADIKDKLKYFGQLAGVPTDTILATIEAILTGDAEDLVYVWQCMTDMNVELTARRKWINSWRYYLKQGIPPSIKEKIVGTTERAAEGKAGEESAPGKDKDRDYIIVDDIPVRVGPGAGDYSLSDAKDIIQISALRNRFGGTRGGGGTQGWSLPDLVSLIDKINEKRGGETAAKLYAFEQTEQGTVLKEVTPGTPLNLNPLGGGKSQPQLIIDSDGVVQEYKPGIRVGPKPASGTPPAQKITLVRQTDKGVVKEEYSAGEVIILNNPAPGGGPMNMVPFPVFGADGRPVLDSEGKPVYANLEPTLKYLGFQADQRRADERNQMLGSLTKTIRENFTDILAAAKAVTEEARKEATGAGATAAQPQGYKCGQCQTVFTIPNAEFEKVTCPGCKHEYTRAEVLAA